MSNDEVNLLELGRDAWDDTELIAAFDEAVATHVTADQTYTSKRKIRNRDESSPVKRAKKNTVPKPHPHVYYREPRQQSSSADATPQYHQQQHHQQQHYANYPAYYAPGAYHPNPYGYHQGYYGAPHQPSVPFQYPAPPPPPPPPPQCIPPVPLQRVPETSTNKNEELTDLLLAWYYSGYYTGRYMSKYGNQSVSKGDEKHTKETESTTVTK